MKHRLALDFFKRPEGSAGVQLSHAPTTQPFCKTLNHLGSPQPQVFQAWATATMVHRPQFPGLLYVTGICTKNWLYSPVTQWSTAPFGNLFHLIIIGQNKQVSLETTHFIHFIHDVFVDPIHDFLDINKFINYMSNLHIYWSISSILLIIMYIM